jgi:hypothetical protein
MGMSPTSGPFRSITGAAVAYGLTAGAAQAPEIGITPLGMRVVRPTTEGDDLVARREALLRPKIIGEFLRRYDGAAIPPDEIAKNVLHELGVPSDRLKSVFELITQGATSVGFVRDYGGKRYIDLASDHMPTADEASGAGLPTGETGEVPGGGTLPANARVAPIAASGTPVAVSVGQGIHINIEIHIAADASSDTIEDIFRNMRRYVLNGPGQPDDAAATA